MSITPFPHTHTKDKKRCYEPKYDLMHLCTWDNKMPVHIPGESISGPRDEARTEHHVSILRCNTDCVPHPCALTTPCPTGVPTRFQALLRKPFPHPSWPQGSFDYGSSS